MEKITKELRRAVHEYYAWHGDKCAKPVRFVKAKSPSDYHMLLVRFTSSGGDKLVSLMDFQEWADGHWDVTEQCVDIQENEEEFVSAFESAESGLVYC